MNFPTILPNSQQPCINDSKLRKHMGKFKQNTEIKLYPHCSSLPANPKSQVKAEAHLDCIKLEIKVENNNYSTPPATAEFKCKTTYNISSNENDIYGVDLIFPMRMKLEFEDSANSHDFMTEPINIGIKDEVEIEPTKLQWPDVHYNQQHVNLKHLEYIEHPEDNRQETESTSPTQLAKYDLCVDREIEKHYECSICYKKISSHYSLKRHLSKTHRVIPYACTVCRKTFAEDELLQKHMERHTFQSFECSFCKKIFSEDRHLKNHIYTHTGEKPFQCAICQCKFNQSSALSRHMRKHTGERPFECLVCQKKFSDRGSLTKHLRVHTGEKPFECSICWKRFSQSNILTLHMRMHTGYKPYECSFCKKTFSRKGGLNLHTRSHTGERPYECLHCRMKFTDRSHLVRHITIKHKIGKSSVTSLNSKMLHKSENYKLFVKLVEH